MKKLLTIFALAVVLVGTAWTADVQVSVLNPEPYRFWYVLDPEDFASEAPDSPVLIDKAASFLTAEGGDFPFEPLESGQEVVFVGLPEGLHYLFGFFESDLLDDLPVQLMAFEVDNTAGDFGFEVLSIPELFMVSRGIGRLAGLPDALIVLAEEQTTADAEAVVEEAVVEEAVVEEAVVEETVVEEVVVEEAVVEEAVVEEAVVEEAVVEEAVAEEAVVEEAVVEEAVVEEAVAEEAVVEEAVVEEAVVEEAVVEEAVVEEAVAEETVVEEVVVEEAVVEEAVVEEAVVEEAVVEEAVVEEAVVEEAVAEETVVEEAVEPEVLASFSEYYDPVYFTRESRDGFIVLPIASSQAWGQPGTRLSLFSGVLYDGDDNPDTQVGGGIRAERVLLPLRVPRADRREGQRVHVRSATGCERPVRGGPVAAGESGPPAPRYRPYRWG